MAFKLGLILFSSNSFNEIANCTFYVSPTNSTIYIFIQTSLYPSTLEIVSSLELSIIMILWTYKKHFSRDSSSICDLGISTTTQNIRKWISLRIGLTVTGNDQSLSIVLTLIIIYYTCSQSHVSFNCSVFHYDSLYMFLIT